MENNSVEYKTSTLNDSYTYVDNSVDKRAYECYDNCSATGNYECYDNCCATISCDEVYSYESPVVYENVNSDDCYEILSEELINEMLNESIDNQEVGDLESFSNGFKTACHLIKAKLAK